MEERKPEDIFGKKKMPKNNIEFSKGITQKIKKRNQKLTDRTKHFKEEEED